MEKLDGKTFDVVSDNIKKLEELFPEIVTEGKVDVDKLALLFDKSRNEDTDGSKDGEERYEFTWKGKKEAIRMAQKQTTGTLRPCKEESVNFDDTQNLYIEGDNLEVLRTLQSSYRGKIKMIYIDPPYNTGKDFVYKDNFNDNIQNYKEMMNESYKTNTDSSGRFHTDWLNMMYPRLKLARSLIREDGVIFISIGENEVANLKKACDDIFGEINFIGCAGRISKKANNQGDYWAPNFDYLLTYTKDREFCAPFFGGINYKSYNLIEESGPRKGEYYQLIRLYMTSLDPMRGCSNQRYFIECPDGSLVIPPGENYPDEKKDGCGTVPKSGKDKVWRWSLSTYKDNKDKIVVKKVKSSNLVNENGETTYWNVFTKTYLNDVISKSTATPNNFIENHINQNASHELKKLEIPFDFAKPTSLIKFLCETCRVGKDDTILDFFSGSATTADAIMQLNSSDNGNRRFIMIQIPQETDKNSDAYKAGYKTICEIGKERIRRAGKKIVEENKDKEGIEDLDIGFKVFKLDTTNIKEWDDTIINTDEIKWNVEELINPIKDERSQEDVIYEILLKYGVDLTMPIEEIEIMGSKVYSVGFGYLMICLEKDISLDLIEAIGEQKPNRVVLYDNGLDNESKTNGERILKELGVKDIRTI